MHSTNSCMSTTAIYEAFQYYRDEVTLVYYSTVFTGTSARLPTSPCTRLTGPHPVAPFFPGEPPIASSTLGEQ